MVPALEVADIFRRHGEAYRQVNIGHLGRVERRTMSAIELCRTAELGGHVGPPRLEKPSSMQTSVTEWWPAASSAFARSARDSMRN